MRTDADRQMARRNVLAATHCDLKSLVREGKFRQNLFYRLEGMTIHRPRYASGRRTSNCWPGDS